MTTIHMTGVDHLAAWLEDNAKGSEFTLGKGETLQIYPARRVPRSQPVRVEMRGILWRIRPTENPTVEQADKLFDGAAITFILMSLDDNRTELKTEAAWHFREVVSLLESLQGEIDRRWPTWTPAFFNGVSVPGWMYVSPVTGGSTYSTGTETIIAHPTVLPAGTTMAFPTAPPAGQNQTAPAPAVADNSQKSPAVFRPKTPSALSRWKAQWALMKSCRARTLRAMAKRAGISPDTAAKIRNLAEVEGWR